MCTTLMLKLLSQFTSLFNLHTALAYITVVLCLKALTSRYRVKSCDFGQRVNSDINLQTVKIQIKSRLSSGFSLFAQLIQFLFQ